MKTTPLKMFEFTQRYEQEQTISELGEVRITVKARSIEEALRRAEALRDGLPLRPRTGEDIDWVKDKELHIDSGDFEYTGALEEE